MGIFGSIGKSLGVKNPGDLAGLAASAIPGVGEYMGAKEANIANAKLASDQMSFQKEMSNTAYQRAMQDMKKAGLNPMLAYSQGGASTPTGAMATMQNTKLGMGKLASSAMDAVRLKNETKQVDSQTEPTGVDYQLKEAQRHTQESQTLKNATESTAKLLEVNRSKANDPELRESQRQLALAAAANARTERKKAQIDEKMAVPDAIGSRLREVIKGANSAKNAFLPLPTGGYTDENYDAQGEHRGSRTRRYHK